MTGLLEKFCCLKLTEDLLLLLGFGVYISQHGDVREVYPELAQQSGHPVRGKSKKNKTKSFETSCGTISSEGAVDRDNSTESS